MTTKQYFENTQANEAVSKFKLLSAYGGPGSIIHTAYGSIIVSCIEEWGFLKRILDIQKEAVETGKKEKEIKGYIIEQARLERNGSVGLSNDTRLLNSLINRKGLTQLKYLVLIPEISVQDFSNKIKNNGNELAINSTFMPKVFFDKSKRYKFYKEWFKDWTSNKKNDDQYGNKFFPPKYNTDKGTYNLTQDNIVLICDHGHISDFPWSKYLKWRSDSPMEINSDIPIDLFNSQPCCGNEDSNMSKIFITSSSANASGFDGKWLKCENCGKQTSLKGLMSVKIKCPGHKPWEGVTSNKGELKYHSGNEESRNKMPSFETCLSRKSMKVALTTGNNLYYSRMLSSIYMPDELFLDEKVLKIKELNIAKELAKEEENIENLVSIVEQIKLLEKELDSNPLNVEKLDSQKDVFYRFEEFKALAHKTDDEINIDKKHEHLKVKDVTFNIKNSKIEKYFSKILRIDNMKITSAQLDFSRVVPVDSDADNISSKDIFRNKKDSVQVYPVVENYGEGIFFSFNEELINEFAKSDAIFILNENLKKLYKNSDTFSEGAIKYGLDNNWQLYIVHTFAHLIMRELEFKCGYPTASLSERIYVSNDAKYKMYGCMIYTAEGAEGSMGGLIAQTRPNNLLSLIQSALKRATICNSDPLCWESEGQGLFELNFASCFSCSLVSETSCEHRNIYLDRRILVDENSGFFKDVLL
jgi:hypothetical protein